MKRKTSLAGTLAATTALLLMLSETGIAQTRPLVAEPDGPFDIRAALGDCPMEELRAAYAEMLPLESAAVDREVLAICTERAEAIARFLGAQERLDAALAERRAPSFSTTPAGTGNDDLELLRGEVAGLRERIARLEREPERPETETTLADLRDDLARAEADLARLEGGEPASGTSDLPSPIAAVPEMAGPVTSPAADGVPQPGTEVLAVPAADTERRSADGIAAAQPGTAEGAAPLPPPGTGLSTTSPAMRAQAGQGLLPECRSEWRVIHAVRRDGGPWQVRLQALREEAVPLPAPVPEDPAAPATLRDFLCAPVLDPPVTLAVGETLPDGLELLAVTPDGVELTDPGDPEAGPVLVRFDTAGNIDPGALEWDVQVFLGAGQ